MKATIILDSGAFLLDESNGQSYVDVGYFESKGSTDITVRADGPLSNPASIKLGKKQRRIDVRHVAADGSMKSGTNLSPSFDQYLLRKRDLYQSGAPPFTPDAFDCIIRFSSGDFYGWDVTPRLFKQCAVAGGAYTGRDHTTKPIANDIIVNYELAVGDVLRLVSVDQNGTETELLSSDKIAPGANRLEIKFEADDSCNEKYYKHALNHQGKHCWLPNPNPPPLNS
ncbi:MAG TPA: hypothetical protein VJH03_21825 [Blastocatellia bacterium]|nr:hypothetical protein [Blastocatellia bacterium]